MDGAELIHTIRKRSTMPVLVLSYDGSIHHMKKAFASGADDFLVNTLFVLIINDFSSILWSKNDVILAHPFGMCHVITFV